jgi:outer membrane lipoprotein
MDTRIFMVFRGGANSNPASGLTLQRVPVLVRVLSLVGVLSISGCASVPDGLGSVPERMPALETVQAASESEFRGATILWGGVIAHRRNLADGSMMEVVARPLDRQQRPREVDLSAGRFRVYTSQFLEPETFREGREVTVRGTISGLGSDRVDEFPYRFPEVQAEFIQLWPLRPEPIPLYWREPLFWDPWGPRFGYP